MSGSPDGSVGRGSAVAVAVTSAHPKPVDPAPGASVNAVNLSGGFGCHGGAPVRMVILIVVLWLGLRSRPVAVWGA